MNPKSNRNKVRQVGRKDVVAARQNLNMLGINHSEFVVG